MKESYRNTSSDKSQHGESVRKAIELLNEAPENPERGFIVVCGTMNPPLIPGLFEPTLTCQAISGGRLVTVRHLLMETVREMYQSLNRAEKVDFLMHLAIIVTELQDGNAEEN